MSKAAEVYESELYDYNHGVPLWFPEPVNNVEEIYIGDVGYLDGDRQFHRLFNVRVCRDNVLNKDGVPEDFRPLDVPQRRIDIKDNYLAPHEPMVSNDIKKEALVASVSADLGE